MKSGLLFTRAPIVGHENVPVVQNAYNNPQWIRQLDLVSISNSQHCWALQLTICLKKNEKWIPYTINYHEYLVVVIIITLLNQVEFVALQLNSILVFIQQEDLTVATSYFNIVEITCPWNIEWESGWVMKRTSLFWVKRFYLQMHNFHLTLLLAVQVHKAWKQLQ